MKYKIDEILCRSVGYSNDLLLFDNNSPILISFVNPYSYYLLADRDDILDDVDFLFADGALLCACHNLFFRPKLDRISFDFSSIAENVFFNAELRGLSVCLIGGSDTDIVKSVRYLSIRFPSLKISFWRSGYFFSDLEREESVTEAINSGASLFIVGLGTPLQEEYSRLIKSRCAGRPVIIFTCGGFISQTADHGDYYLPIVKRLGLRWLQRFVLHSHVRRRVLLDYPFFLVRYVRKHLFV